MNLKRLLFNTLSIIVLLAIIILSVFFISENTVLLDRYRYQSTSHGQAEVDQSLQETLQHFKLSTWDEYTTLEQEAAIEELVEELSDHLELSKVPNIEFRANENMEELGAFGSHHYTIYLNPTGLHDGVSYASIIAHEMRHAWQYVRSLNPQTEQDEVFKENHENYIEWHDDYGAYYNQPLEVDARNFERFIINHLY